MAMGGEFHDTGGYQDICNQLLYLDTECIEGHGDYKKIITHLIRMSKLEIDNLRDYVDVEKGQAWVAFSHNKKFYKWKLNINHDWLDMESATRFTVPSTK